MCNNPKNIEEMAWMAGWHGCADRESSLQGILLWLMVDHNTIDVIY